MKVKTETYNKPVGYIAPVSNVNIGRKEEFDNRENFVLEAEKKSESSN